MSKFKQGTVEKVKTGKGWTWYYRFTTEDGKRPRLRIGPVSELKSKAAAWRAAEPIVKRLSGPVAHRKTFGDLLDLYIEKKMPQRHSTRRGYMSIINAHIRPKWGNVPLEDVKSAKVEEWLLGLSIGNYRKGHILNVMRLLFKNAMHYEWLPLTPNPMNTFSIEGSKKRAKEPGTITEEQFRELLEVLPDGPYRAMVTVAQGLGLRVSELLALQWGDLDILGGELRVCRAIVEQHVGEVKTYQSKKSLPLHPRVKQMLLDWRKQTEFTEPEHFIFASRWQAGELPYSATDVQSKILRPAGKRIGLTFSLGWHTFRHSYRAFMRKHGASLDIQRDLMRHADIYMTSKYGGTGVEELRPINESVVESLFGGKQ